MSRTILVSNRLPWTVSLRDGRGELKPTSGGLATALAGTHAQGDTSWIGWPGDLSALPEEEQARVLEQLRERRFVPLALSAEEVERYYEGFSNGVLWPMFHYLLDKVRLDADLDWDAYVAVNERFAEAIAEVARAGDKVWVHDYQLMLVPRMLRELRPDLHIGFFLHIPFPAQEIFRILPWREALLQGLLAADLVGFHTRDYRDHFRTCAVQLLGAEPEPGGVRYCGQSVRLAHYAIGIDAAGFARTAALPEVKDRVATIRQETHGRKLLLGLDRLDYTKGIPRRLLAFERYLERHPSVVEQVMLVQVAVPSRQGVEGYDALRRQVDQLAGRINGRFGSPRSVPVHLLHQSVPFEELVALYAAADAMIVTPLRDGMNLVAKEFCASRNDEAGVLVLSEFAGAAAELKEALLVNPYNIGAVADTMARAIEIDAIEGSARMRALRRRIFHGDVHRWAERFMADLDLVDLATESSLQADLVQRLLQESARAQKIELMLDYDGTLVPFAEHPDQATPDEGLIRLLGDLASLARVRVHLVSGRSRETLGRWFEGMPMSLHAEHGFWRREPGEASWQPCIVPRLDWMDDVITLLESWVERFPGTHIEHKTSSLAWHYRLAQAGVGERTVRALRGEARTILERHALELLEGAKVIEFRIAGVHKGMAFTPEMNTEDTLVVAIGDDRTDEDLFAALPPSGLSIRVGQGPSRATYRLANPQAVRALLRAFHQALSETPVAQEA